MPFRNLFSAAAPNLRPTKYVASATTSAGTTKRRSARASAVREARWSAPRPLARPGEPVGAHPSAVSPNCPHSSATLSNTSTAPASRSSASEKPPVSTAIVGTPARLAASTS
jgi:hypothetical protein